MIIVSTRLPRLPIVQNQNEGWRPEEFLVPLKMSAGALAKVCGLARTRIERIASEQTGITADTALRLAKALGTTAQLWLNLQNDYDFRIAKRDLGKILDRIETVNKPKAA